MDNIDKAGNKEAQKVITMIGNMDKKSFFLGMLTGAAAAFAVLVVIGLAYQKPPAIDSIQYLETPESYENKLEAKFEIIQVFDETALATERELEISTCGEELYKRGLISADQIDTIKNEKVGKTVLLLGEGFYSEQIVKVKNPQRTGIYSYTTKGGSDKVVPVITGELE